MTYDLEIARRGPLSTSRRTFLSSAAALIAFAEFSPMLAHQSTPVSKAEGDTDALAVLEAAGKEVLELETFTFALTTTNGSSTIFPGVELISVEGAIRRPVDLAATVTVKAFVQTLELSAIAVDGDFYIQEPMGGGNWQEMGSASEIANMVNPDWIIVAAVNMIKDAKITSDEDGLTLIEGYLDLAASIEEMQGGDLAQLREFLADGPIDVAFWINPDNLIERIELYGPIFASESADVEKRIELSDFNEPVDIERPVL